MEVMLTTCPECAGRMCGRTARVTFRSPKTFVAKTDLSGRCLLHRAEQASPGIVDQDVDGAEPCDGGFSRGHRLALVGDVESHRQEPPGKARSGGERRLDLAQAPCRRNDIGTGFERV